MRFRYLTFDCYGTLIDWKRGIEASQAGVFGESLRGKALLDAYVLSEKIEEKEYKKYREVLRRSALRLSKRLGVNVSQEAAKGFAASVPSWPAFGDSVRFLQEAGAKGYRRYILSNIDTDMLESTIRINGLEVDGYVTAEQVGSYKPKRGHWLRFMEMTGARRDEVLHVAQSVFHDIAPTGKLGISSAWVNRYKEPMRLGVHPQFVSDTLAHLATLLDGK